MEDFDGPHYEPGLIGPDGRLTRLHKGKANKQAAAIAQQSAAAQAEASRAAQAAANSAAEQFQAQSNQQSAAMQAQYAGMSAQLETVNANATPPPTQVIVDDRKKKRGAFGISSTRAVNAYALGGKPSTLG